MSPISPVRTRHEEAKGDRQAFQQDIWEEHLTAAAKAAGVDLNKMGPRKSDPDKVLLAAVMKATTAVSNGWLAERLAMGTPASASQFVRRFHLDGKASDRRYRKLLSKVET